jgi:hypothetical protein
MKTTHEIINKRIADTKLLDAIFPLKSNRARKPKLTADEKRTVKDLIFRRIRAERTLQRSKKLEVLFRNTAGTHKGFGVVVSAVYRERSNENHGYEEAHLYGAPSECDALIARGADRAFRNTLDRYDLDAAEYNHRLLAATSGAYLFKSGLDLYDLQTEDEERALCYRNATRIYRKEA